jgi:hypothetical protein
LAKKTNSDASEIDLPVFEYFKSCGVCHPGGGPAEIDRSGNRYDDQSTWQDSTSMDGDYYKNHWLESGSLELDCMLCHGENYDIMARSAQVTVGSFRSAPAAGAGFGTAVDNHTVTYGDIFDDQGNVSPHVSHSPEDHNCTRCHAARPGDYFAGVGAIRSDLAKRGMSWDDPDNSDVHNQAGMHCVTCHTAGGDHQIAKGHEPSSHVRDDLDNSMIKCAGCHSQGNSHGAPVPAHENFSQRHLDRIDCATCHIPRKGIFAVRQKDFTMGPVQAYFVGGSPQESPPFEGFTPSYIWWAPEEGAQPKIYPVNLLGSSYWNEGMERDHPVFVSTMTQAAGSVTITSDVLDSRPEINTAAEIEAMRMALMGLGVSDPILTAYARPFLLSHNVAPAIEALGANGNCADCHRGDSPFFLGQVQVVPFAYDASPYVRIWGDYWTRDGAAVEVDLQAVETMNAFLRYSQEQLDSLTAPVSIGGEEGKGGALPHTYRLGQNFPNPFNPVTSIQYTVPGAEGEKAQVRLAVFDLRGRLVRSLVEGLVEAGPHAIVWDGRDEEGEKVASGTYLYRLTTGDLVETRKMIALN